MCQFNEPYSIRDVPTPQPSDIGPHALLIKVAAVSFCHTDNMVRSGIFSSPLPITASHEGTGTIVAVGSEVKNLKPGD
jgi:propanol-preferring alcohol dehydrogenase